jgi:intracellular septation protein
LSIAERKSLALRLLIEFGPVVVFLIVARILGFVPGTGAFLAATLAATAYSLAHHRRIPIVPACSLSVTLVLGGLTMAYSDPLFIMLRPTILNSVSALLLMMTLLRHRIVLTEILGTDLGAGRETWRRITWRAVAFLAGLALTNEVARQVLSPNDWLVFKAFGLPALNFLFIAANWRALQAGRSLRAARAAPGPARSAR